ncbi:MAG: hypothetical protein V4574_08735 [Pseudomonadota bacterium]
MIRLIFLGLIAAAYAVVCMVSPHGYWLTDLPRVAKVADLPPAAIPADFAMRLRKTGLSVPVERSDLPYEASPVRVGFSFRNFEGLKLPFVTYNDMGFVLYAESRRVTQIVPLDDAGKAALAAAAGRDLTQGYRFPWWQYSWGWLFVAALAVWLVFQFAHEARVRKAEGEGVM